MAITSASTLCLVLALLFASALLQANAAATDATTPPLTYLKGGKDWGGVCETGRRQSPVNLITEEMEPMVFFKDMVNIKSLGVYTDMHMFVTSKLPHFEINWETVVAEANITVPATAEGNIFLPLTEPYPREKLTQVHLEPKQFHYHVHSESAVDGKFHDGVVHIVTMVKDGESEMCDRIKIAGGLGCPVVLAVFLSKEETHSKVHDQFLMREIDEDEDAAEIIGEKPLIIATGEEYAAEVDGTFDLTTMLPKDGKYATWEGSLTTSPCTEGVLWVSFLTPKGMDEKTETEIENMISLAAGEDCISISNGLCAPPRPKFDSRDLQPLNGRPVRTGRAYY